MENIFLSPTPDVSWYFNNETKITSGLNGYELPTSKFNRNLIIQSVMKSKHEGNYTCRAKNTEGEVIAHTYLKVQGTSTCLMYAEFLLLNSYKKIKADFPSRVYCLR